MGSLHDKDVHNLVISMDPLDTRLSLLLPARCSFPGRSRTWLGPLEEGGRGEGIE